MTQSEGLDAIIGFTFTADTRQAHAQKASKSLCVQWASIIACWCCPVHMKQLPFPARFAAPQTVRSVVSHCGDGGGGGGDAGGCFGDEPQVKL